MSNAQEDIGKMIEGRSERDAIHVAIIPVQAAETLQPGQHIGFAEGGWQVTATPKEPHKLIGIVDPFLPSGAAVGQRFYMLLYPQTITGLRHNWSHPAISQDGQGVGSPSEKWLRDFASSVDADYHHMMQIAATHCASKEWGGDYLIDGGKWEGQTTPEEFWTHFEIVTGKKPNDKYGKPGIFSCSC